MSYGMIHWLNELNWARKQIRLAKTVEERVLAIKYHKEICELMK